MVSSLVPMSTPNDIPSPAQPATDPQSFLGPLS
jgi:hypothetical protein